MGPKNQLRCFKVNWKIANPPYLSRKNVPLNSKNLKTKKRLFTLKVSFLAWHSPTPLVSAKRRCSQMARERGTRVSQSQDVGFRQLSRATVGAARDKTRQQTGDIIRRAGREEATWQTGRQHRTIIISDQKKREVLKQREIISGGGSSLSPAACSGGTHLAARRHVLEQERQGTSQTHKMTWHDTISQWQKGSNNRPKAFGITNPPSCCSAVWLG